MTALQKKDGGVRGVATGTVFRRLVAKVARQFSDEVEAALHCSLQCQPEQGRFASDSWTVLSMREFARLGGRRAHHCT